MVTTFYNVIIGANKWTKKIVKKRRCRNLYRKGANSERALVNELALKANTILVGRFASSKCKGKIKADVICLTPDSVKIYQLKKSKNKFKAEREAFDKVDLPSTVKVEREFIQIE